MVGRVTPPAPAVGGQGIAAMLLQTNSYIVPKDKRAEHQRLIRRFRQTLKRLGCDHFEVYEQVGANWSNSEASGRYVQILRFVDRKHQLSVQTAERSDPTAQAVIADFCDLINFPYQQQQGLFAVGFYTSVLPVAPRRGMNGELISTVEHEVIDDPEAERGDPPPLEGMTLDEAVGPADDEVGVQDGVQPAAAPARRHAMIDSVVVDSPTTAPGELFDVLEADAPVDGLEGTPPETEPLDPPLSVPHTVPASHASGIPLPDGAGPFYDESAVDDEGPDGLVLEDAVDVARPPTRRPLG